jgi:hypothetical protein
MSLLSLPLLLSAPPAPAAGADAVRRVQRLVDLRPRLALLALNVVHRVLRQLVLEDNELKPVCFNIPRFKKLIARKITKASSETNFVL